MPVQQHQNPLQRTERVLAQNVAMKKLSKSHLRKGQTAMCSCTDASGVKLCFYMCICSVRKNQNWKDFH